MINTLKCILYAAKSEYVKWITNPRVIIVGVLLVFMRTLAIDPLLERAEKIDSPLNIFEPFVATGNSGMLVMLMPCVFMVLISDYPKMTGNTLFFIQRTGRINWFMGQIVFVLMAIVSFLCTILAGSIILSKGEFLSNWSDAVTKYAARFPHEADSFTAALLPSNLYNQIPVDTAVFQTLLLLCAYLFLLSMIIYFFKLIHIRSFGLFAAIFTVAAGVVTCSLKTDIMWIFPMANTLTWLHYEEILAEPAVPIWYSYIYFCAAIVISVILNIEAVKRFRFTSIEEG